MSVADLPSCALECLLSAIANSSCAATDTACTCADAALKSQSTLCTEKACTTIESLTTENITNTICGVEPRYDESWFLPGTVLLGIMILVVALRCLARLTLKMAFWWDDYVNFIATAVVIADYIIVDNPMKRNGFGMDIWAIPPTKIFTFLKYNYADSLVYVVARLATRVSIVLFYTRVFSPLEHRRKIMITQVVNITLSGTFLIALALQCTPVSYYWNRLYSTHAGHCISQFDFVWVAFTTLIAFDFWLMWIPVPIVAKLQLPLKDRLFIYVMFATGFAVIGVGIAKFRYIGLFTSITNPTYEGVPMYRLCFVEIELGVICSCMPSLPTLVRSAAKYIVGKSKSVKGSLTGYASGSGRMSGSKQLSVSTNYLSPYSQRFNDTSRSEEIEMITTIHQTSRYWQDELNSNVVLQGVSIAPGAGQVRTKAWAGSEYIHS